MKLRISFLLSLFFVSIGTWGWAQARKMSPTINKSATSTTAPAIAGDGSRIVYLSDYSLSGDYTMMMSVNKGGWQAPVELPTTFNNAKVNYVFGHSLSFDGKTLYYSTRKGNSKGYDIWYVTLENEQWSRPFRLPPVINSELHEASPSFTPDGTEMYFTRCTAMLTYNASGCDIFYSKLENGNWSIPEALPDKINAANDQAPKILVDGKTLIYASNKPGGKGKFDLYQTRKTADGWSDPVPIEMANTPEDEIVSSIRMYGNILLAGRTSGKTDQIMEYFIPQELKPEKVMYMNYQLNRDFFAKEATLLIQDMSNGTILRRSKVDSGRHHLVLNEGTVYHMMIQPTHLKRSIVSERFDLREMDRPVFTKAEYDLTTMRPGLTMQVEGIDFQSSSPHISEKSNTVLDHINKMVKLNADLNFELQLVMSDYMEDTLFVHEDMTEVRYDTTYTTRMDTVFIEPAIDSLVETDGDSVSLILTIDSTSTTASLVGAEEVASLDSTALSINVPVDSTASEPQYELIEVVETHVTRIYHNDRSEKEAEELRTRLQMSGVPDDRISITRVREEASQDSPQRFLRIILR